LKLFPIDGDIDFSIILQSAAKHSKLPVYILASKVMEEVHFVTRKAVGEGDRRWNLEKEWEYLPPAASR
jgi:hypothetical protein